MTKLFKTISGIFAVIPGLGVLLSGLAVLPGKKLLFAGAVEAICCLCILALYLNREKIQAMAPARITRLLIGSVAVFVLSLSLYIFLYGTAVFEDHGARTANPKAEAEDYSVLFPIIVRGKVQHTVANFGNRQDAVDQIGAELMNAQIKEDGLMYVLTIISFLLVYLVVAGGLTFPFVLFSVHERIAITDQG